MNITRSFESTDRYHYDFGVHSSAKGWAHFDTINDCSFYGQWTNPFLLQFASFVEGDYTLVECESKEEYIEYINNTREYYEDGFKGIDSRLNPEIHEEFVRLGLENLLHVHVSQVQV